jgi:hypothetical protein
MSSMKTLMVMCVLGAAGYWMYINMGHKLESAPADAPEYASPPTVQIPGLNTADAQTAAILPGGSSSAPPPLFGGSSQVGIVANTSPVSTSGVPSPTDVSGASLLAPPLASNATNSPQVETAPGTTSGLPGGATANQTPSAVYPAPSNASPPSISSVPENSFQSKFDSLMQAIQKNLEAGRLAESHLALSTLYDNPDLPPAQARQVTELLDQLAGTVIYSRQHFLEQAYIVQSGDTLDRIAEQYNVPSLLLARINGITNPQQLEPGRELKVVRGPFNAIIHLERHELSLMVGGRYAGRFAIGVGCDQPKLEGEYVVREKNTNPLYRGPGGVTTAGGDLRNPLGKFWIGLSDNVGLHGTVDPQNIGRDDNRGTICLGDRDIDDLYGILSVGSRVVIQR